MKCLYFLPLNMYFKKNKDIFEFYTILTYFVNVNILWLRMCKFIVRNLALHYFFQIFLLCWLLLGLALSFKNKKQNQALLQTTKNGILGRNTYKIATYNYVVICGANQINTYLGKSLTSPIVCQLFAIHNLKQNNCLVHPDKVKFHIKIQ